MIFTEENAQALVDYVLEPENALRILRKHYNPKTAMRADAKSGTRLLIDLALCRAFVALENEAKAKGGTDVNVKR